MKNLVWLNPFHYKGIEFSGKPTHSLISYVGIAGLVFTASIYFIGLEYRAPFFRAGVAGVILMYVANLMAYIQLLHDNANPPK